jgi:hypothetical protein
LSGERDCRAQGVSVMQITNIHDIPRRMLGVGESSDATAMPM